MADRDEIDPVEEVDPVDQNGAIKNGDKSESRRSRRRSGKDRSDRAEREDRGSAEDEDHGETEEHAAIQDGLARQIGEMDEASALMLADAAEDATGSDEKPCLFLVVPRLEVDEVEVEADDLDANIRLNAELLNLLNINVGVDAHLDKLKINVRGVRAQALLKVRLREVRGIIDRVCTTIDRNPEVFKELLRPVGEAVEDVGEGAGGAVEDVGEGAGDLLGGDGEGVTGAIGGAVDAASEAAEDGGGGFVRRTARGARELARQVVGRGEQGEQGEDEEDANGNGGRRMLGEFDDDEGRTVQWMLETSGDITEAVLDENGEVTEERVVGNASELIETLGKATRTASRD